MELNVYADPRLKGVPDADFKRKEIAVIIIFCVVVYLDEVSVILIKQFAE